MVDYLMGIVSELDLLQIPVLVISVLMVIIGAKKIISHGFILFLWLVVALMGAVGVVYSINPPLFEEVKLKVQDRLQGGAHFLSEQQS